MDVDGHPLYLKGQTRLDMAMEHVALLFLVNNQNVVPHNPFSFRKYGCYINIKVCASICFVKYIHNYIYKGHNCLIMLFGHEPNEVVQYFDVQYVTAPKATWCLLIMEMNEEQPNVICLALHLLGMDKVVFNANDGMTLNLQKVEHGMTTTFFFEMCYRCKY
jgi:hypothetical protein